MAEDPNKPIIVESKCCGDEEARAAEAEAREYEAAKKQEKQQEEAAKKQEGFNKALLATTEKFNEERNKKNQEAINAEQIEKGKVAKSTMKQIELNGGLMSNINGTIDDMIKNSDMSVEEQVEMTDKVREIMVDGDMSGAGVQATLQNLGKEIGELPGAVEMLAKSGKEAKKNESKVEKLKAKEDKADKKKLSFSFQDSVDKVKDVGKSAFAKIKDVLFKGALIAFLLNLPKILNSEAFKPILEYFTGGSFESDIKALWNNVLLPIFNGIVDTIKFIVALFQGDFDTAIQLFKDNWIMIIPILAIALAAIVASFGPVIAIAAGLALAFIVIKNFLDDLVEKLNVSSITDLVFIAWGYVQDAFASFVNMLIDLVNMVTGLVNKFGKFLGFDIDIPQFEKLATNNAETALKAAQLKKAEADRKAAEEDKQQAANQQSNVVANSGNTNISTNSSSVTNMVSQGMPDVSQLNNFNMDEALAMS